MRYSQVVNFALASYFSRERYTRRKTSCARSSATAALCSHAVHKTHHRPTIFLHQIIESRLIAAFTRSITSRIGQSFRGLTVCMSPRHGRHAAIASNPRLTATLLTVDLTRSGSESCAGCQGQAELGPEVPL